MTQTPGVERDDLNFDESLQKVLETMRRNMEGSVKADGVGRAMREAHAKGCGLARGEVEILEGLTDAYAQGIYRKPARHEAMVRFSNGVGHLGPDRLLGSGCGIGPKIFGIEGKTLLEDKPERWRSGAPLTLAPTKDDPALDEDLRVHRPRATLRPRWPFPRWRYGPGGFQRRACAACVLVIPNALAVLISATAEAG
jgi:hypothetical protein